jgi:DNA ligase 1
VLLDSRLHGLDGEIIIGPPNVPEVLVRTLPVVLWSRSPNDFGFFVFDDFTDPRLPFTRRIELARARVEALALPSLHVLPQWLVKDASALFRTYEQFLAEGFEGGVLRSPEGRYKGGRVTEASQIAIKIKPGGIMP